MGNAKAEREELKKLEDEAYNELCQIIAEAMQFQDITLLDQRIANWKKKYKKLLDSSSPSSSNFKKRIEYLLNQFYSEITQYILKQIKKSEQKRIENQSKALRKLHYIIKETDDLALLKKKVKEWEDKYPISGFITMYQKRIKVYTSEKYLKENSFDQDMAFRDLYYITKLNRTYDEFKEELSKWEDKYSIHDKFELDDFIKHQSDVNRYTSDEYLKSIARADNSDNQEIVLPGEKIPNSSPEKQASAYASLMSVARRPNNIDEIFDWVYKYNSIKFNDEYKDLILRAIYLDYSPTYLSSLSVPKINLSSSLSFEEYENIDEIKRYTVISYFNLLLPPDRRISNNYFSEHIEKIYRKSRTAQFSNKYNEVDSILEETDNLKTTPDKIEIPELGIDLSDGQVFSITDDIISEKLSEKSVDKTPQEPQVHTSAADTQKNEEYVSTESATEEQQIQSVITTEDMPIVEETPNQTEPDSLIETAVVKVEDKKSEDQRSEDFDSTAQSSEVIIPAKDSEPQKGSSLEPICASKALEADSSLTMTETTSEKSQDKSVVVTDEPKVIVPEASEKSQPENLIVSIKGSEISAVEFKKNTEELKMHVSNESQEFEEPNEDLSSDTIIALSPYFFEIMNNKVNMQKQQATIVTMIDTHVENYMSMTIDKTNDISKTRIDSN